MVNNPVIQELIDKTFRELNQSDKPIQRSRVSNTPNGYIHLIAWSNAQLLRLFVRRFTDVLFKSEHRLKAQTNDAARSVIANIEEGFGRPTTGEYLTFLGYSQASLIEVKGDIQRAAQDGLLQTRKGSTITDLGIHLSTWHEALKQSVISKPIEPSKILQTPLTRPQHIYTAVARPTSPFKFLYPPVDDLQASQLTCEIFIELINKTGWHLRRLVESLEDKLNRDQKYYQVEKARIRSQLRMK